MSPTMEKVATEPQQRRTFDAPRHCSAVIARRSATKLTAIALMTCMQTTANLIRFLVHGDVKRKEINLWHCRSHARDVGVASDLLNALFRHMKRKN